MSFLVFSFLFFSSSSSKMLLDPGLEGSRDRRDGSWETVEVAPTLGGKKLVSKIKDTKPGPGPSEPMGHRSRWMVVALTRLSPSWPEPVHILSLSLSGIKIALSDPPSGPSFPAPSPPQHTTFHVTVPLFP